MTNPFSRYVQVKVTSDTLLLLVAIGQLFYQQWSMTGYHREAKKGREAILAQGHANEIALANHIKAATERWDLLRRQNQNIYVPSVDSLPLDKMP